MRANLYSLSLAALISLSFIQMANAEQKPIDKLTLKPGEEKSFSVPSSEPVRVGFTTELPIEQMKNCKHNGIQLTAPALGSELSLASPLGTSIEVPAKNGQVTFMLKNMESFPIPLQAERE